MTDYCLNLICPPIVEEKLLDALLGSANVGIFTSSEVRSHGAAHAKLSIAEQVMGRSRAIHISVLLREEALTGLLERVRRDFAGSGIRYWATHVVSQGDIQ